MSVNTNKCGNLYYKVYHIESESDAQKSSTARIKTIYVFYGETSIVDNDGDTLELSEMIRFSTSNPIFSKIFSDIELKTIASQSIPVVFVKDQIHLDDTIDIVKRKIMLATADRLRLSFGEIYLFSKHIETLKTLEVYQQLTNDGRSDLTAGKLESFLLNIDNLSGLSEVSSENGIYRYEDVISLKLDDEPRIINRSVGQEIRSIQRDQPYPYVANPFDVNYIEPFLELHAAESIVTNNKQVILETGLMVNNALYLCTAEDVLKYASEKQKAAVKEGVVPFTEKHAISIYFPHLATIEGSQGPIEIASLADLTKFKDVLVSASKRFVDDRFIKMKDTVNLFYDIYNQRTAEFNYIDDGIRGFDVVLHPANKFHILLDPIFKLIHCTKEIPFIKYNAGKRQDNVFKLYAEKVSKTGRKIPYLSKTDIFNLSRSIGRTKTVAVYIEYIYHNPAVPQHKANDSVLNIVCEFDTDGSVRIRTPGFRHAFTIEEIESIIKATANPVISVIKNYVEQSGYAMELFTSFYDKCVEILDINYFSQLSITKNIEIHDMIGCISSVFNEVEGSLKKGIELRYKRVSNFNEMSSQEAYIIEMINKQNTDRNIVEGLKMNYSISEDEAREKISSVLSAIQMKTNMRRRNVKIQNNPGFLTKITQSPFSSNIKIEVSNIDNILYLCVIPIYIDSILRIYQDIGTTGVDAERIQALCNTGEVKKGVALSEPVSGESVSDVVPEPPLNESSSFGEVPDINPPQNPDAYDAFFKMMENNLESDSETGSESGSELGSESGSAIANPNYESDEYAGGGNSEGGGNSGELDELTGMKLTYPNPISKRLEERDPVLFLKRDEGKYNSYSRSCLWNVRRQPVILSKEEKDRIDKEHPGSYEYSVKYGSNPENPYWYICPRYWDLKHNTSLTEKEAKSGEYGKIIPQDAKEIKKGETIIEFTDNKVHKDSDGKYIQHYPGFLSSDAHPKGHCVPCCFNKWDKPSQKKRREECEAQQERLGEGEKQATLLPTPSAIKEAVVSLFKPQDIHKPQDQSKPQDIHKPQDQEPKPQDIHKPEDQSKPEDIHKPQDQEPKPQDIHKPEDIQRKPQDQEKPPKTPSLSLSKQVNANVNVNENIRVTEIKDDRILSAEKFPLDNNRFGYLPVPLQKFLYNDNRECQVSIKNTALKKGVSCLLRRGVETSPSQSFVSVIAYMYAESRSSVLPTIKQMKAIIAKSITPDNFTALNNGSLIDIFYDDTKDIELSDYRNTALFSSIGSTSLMRKIGNAYENFRSYLMNDSVNIDHTYLWDIVCRQNPSLFEHGNNLIIIEIPEDDVTNNVNIICPTTAFSSETFDANKKTTIVMKKGDYYEPVYLFEAKANGKYEAVCRFSMKSKTLPMKLRKVIETIKNIYFVYCRLRSSLPRIYKFEPNKPAPVIAKLVKDSGFTILNQVMNYSGKTIGFFIEKIAQIPRSTNVKIYRGFVPCAVSPILIKEENETSHVLYPTIYMDDDKLWRDYNTTVQFLKYVVNEIKRHTRQIALFLPVVKVVEDGLIVGILTQTNQFIQMDMNEPTPNQEDDLPTIHDGNYFAVDKEVDNSVDSGRIKGQGQGHGESQDQGQDKGQDQDRVEYVKNIRLETNFYNVFRNTARILLNRPEYKIKRREIEELVNAPQIRYYSKLDRITLALKELMSKYVGFTDYSREVINHLTQINGCITNDDLSCDKKEYCMKESSGLCKLLVPRRNLINPQTDNAKVYYGKLADELIRYERIRLFIFEPMKYLSFSNVSYNLYDDEIILLESLLTPEYFENLVPVTTNPYTKHSTFLTVQPKQTEDVLYDNHYNPAYINAILGTMPISYNEGVDNQNQNQNQVSSSTTGSTSTKQDDTCSTDFKITPVNPKVKSLFPDNVNELLFSNQTTECSFGVFIAILRSFEKETGINMITSSSGISVNNLKQVLAAEYRKLMEKPLFDKKIVSVIHGYGQGYTAYINAGKYTLEQILMSSHYYMTNLDLWLLAKHYKVPVVLYSVMGNLIENDKQMLVMYNPENENPKFYFVRSPPLKQNIVPTYGLIVKSRKIEPLSVDEGSVELKQMIEQGYDADPASIETFISEFKYANVKNRIQKPKLVVKQQPKKLYEPAIPVLVQANAAEANTAEANAAKEANTTDENQKNIQNLIEKANETLKKI
jgi:hypothetical protein